jgi:hypothetical protein
MSESSSFLEQRNEAFREVHSGPTKNDFSVKVDESVYREAMTLKDVQDKNRQAVDDLFKEPEEIGSVFEKGQKLEEKTLSHEKNEIKPTTNNGIDSRGLESIRQESSAQDKTIQQSSVGSNFGL